MSHIKSIKFYNYMSLYLTLHCRVHVYIHILTGVRDGQDAALLLNWQYLIEYCIFILLRPLFIRPIYMFNFFFLVFLYLVIKNWNKLPRKDILKSKWKSVRQTSIYINIILYYYLNNVANWQRLIYSIFIKIKSVLLFIFINTKCFILKFSTVNTLHKLREFWPFS